MESGAPRARRPDSFAVITDVHANLPALLAVFAELDARGISAVFCCGDIVGYGPWPNEVVETLRARGVTAIRGNVDRDVLRFERRKKKLRARRHPDKFRTLEYSAERLSDEARAYLAELPSELGVAVGRRRLLLVHGSPTGATDPVLPDAPDDVLRRHLDETGSNIVVCGHTHLPFVRRIGQRLFVNAGSCGRPSDGDSRACVAVVTLGPRARAEVVRVAYDVERVVEAVATCYLPVALRRLYTEGVDPWRSPADGALPPPPDDAQLQSILGWRVDLGTALGAARANDPEGIHDIRVATRRMRAGLGMLQRRAGTARARRPARRARKLLATLARSLSPSRSLQVHLTILQRQLRRTTGSAKMFIEELIMKRRADLTRELDGARDSIESFPLERLDRLVERAVVQAAAALGPPIVDPANELVTKARPLAVAAVASREERDLHLLRITLKKVRYTLESAGQSGAPLYVMAKRGQGVLGDLHDVDEVLAWLRSQQSDLVAGGAAQHVRECERLVHGFEERREALLGKLDLSLLISTRPRVVPRRRPARSA